MTVAAPLKVVLGSIAFVIFWILAVFPAVPFLPIGRTAGSLLGAMLMVIFQVISPEDAYSAVDLQILGLLFGTMVVSIYLEKEDMFKYLGKLLSWRSKGPKDLISRLCLISAISSALFTNDTACVVLTEFVLKIAKQHNLPPHPFLLALASSANIGSSATPIGNPQNLVIAVQSNISFGNFLIGILPSMLLGVFINGLLIICIYWKVLSIKKRDETDLIISVDDIDSHRFSPASLSHLASPNSHEWIATSRSTSFSKSPSETENRAISSFNDDIERLRSSETLSTRNSSESIVIVSVRDGPLEEKIWSSKRWKHAFWKACVYGVALGMLISLLLGMNMSWTAITAALALVVIDFKDARSSLEKVSYSLLIFFCGMFITVEGLDKTGIPGTLWDLLEPYSRIDSVPGITVLALVILFLSNFASNVPTVLLLGGRVAASAAVISAADKKKAWLILAWVSTVGGNLSLLGSAANLIVCEQARNANNHLAYNLSFWHHLKFGLPSTLVVTAAGLAILR